MKGLFLCVVYIFGGSAVVVAEDQQHTWLVTCAHCTNGQGTTGQVLTPAGPIGVRWTAVDYSTDLALGKCYKGYLSNVAEVSSDVSSVSGTCVCAGFPDGKATVRAYERRGLSRVGPLGRVGLHGSRIYPGFSGGGVFDEKGKLCGIVSHGCEEGGKCSTPSQLDSILSSLKAKTDDDPTKISLRDILIALGGWYFGKKKHLPALPTAA